MFFNGLNYLNDWNDLESLPQKAQWAEVFRGFRHRSGLT